MTMPWNLKENVFKATDLITVFLTAMQSGQKLQCLYGNGMANNFVQN